MLGFAQDESAPLFLVYKTAYGWKKYGLEIVQKAWRD